MTTNEFWKHFEQQVLDCNQAPADYITTKGESNMTQTLTAKAKSPTTIDADVYSIELAQPTELKLWDEGDTCTLIKRDGMYTLDSRYAYVELEISSRTDLWLFQCFEGFALNTLEDIPEIVERHKDGELNYDKTLEMIQSIIQNHTHDAKGIKAYVPVEIQSMKMNVPDFEASANLLVALSIEATSTIEYNHPPVISIKPSSLLERKFLLQIDTGSPDIAENIQTKLRETLHRLFIDFTMNDEGFDKKDGFLVSLHIPAQEIIGKKKLVFDKDHMFADRRRGGLVPKDVFN